jgi:hypothetical protein
VNATIEALTEAVGPATAEKVFAFVRTRAATSEVTETTGPTSRRAASGD